MPLIEQDYSNEAAWVYLRGMLASSDQDEERSQATNTKKVNISKLKSHLGDWLDQCIKACEVKDDKKGLRFALMT